MPKLHQKLQYLFSNNLKIVLLNIGFIFFKPKKPTEISGFVREGRRIRTFDRLLRRQVLYPAELCLQYYKKSGWQDSNLRPPAPKAGAITELRYTPKSKKAESKGFEPLVQLPIRMFSKHVLSATQATLQYKNLYYF